MTSPQFAGRVYLVAGEASILGAVANELAADGALVGLVSLDLVAVETAARFRADPTDPHVWERVVPHVEQRLGPIDGVLTDGRCAALAEQYVGADLRQRGHGAVIPVGPDDDADVVLRKLVDTL